MGGDTSEAIWNMDDEILKIIKYLKVVFLNNMKEWKLDDAYWTLTLIHMEIDAKLKKTEQTKLEEEMKELENHRRNFLEDKKKSGMFFVKLEKIMIKINRKMKEHGCWFREREDYGL